MDNNISMSKRTQTALFMKPLIYGICVDIGYWILDTGYSIAETKIKSTICRAFCEN
jgi:hypothetical protein